MSLSKWLADKGIFEVKGSPKKPERKPPEVQEREPTSDELALGYAYAEDADGNEIFNLTGVPQEDRITHFYIIGASGTGKTKFLEYLIGQDIRNGAGFGVIDPHGDLVKRTMELLSLGAADDLNERVILIDPTDKENTVCFNPLELTAGYTPARQAKELVEVFRRIWSDSWGDRMADILRNTLIALIENNLTLDEVPQFLTDAAFRAKFVPNVKNDKCREYFQNEFDILNPKTRSEWITSTLNKVRTFLADEAVRDIFLSPKSSFNFRDMIDNRKIILARLPKGLLGDENSDLLGSLILSKIQMAAFSRADTPEEGRVPFYLYIDEFQNYAAENFGFVLDEARKYRLALTLAHQNLSQIPAKLKSSLLNCPLQAYFRVSRADAEILAKEMFVGMGGEPQPWESYFQELQILPLRNCIVKNKNGGGIAAITVPEAKTFEEELERMEADGEDVSPVERRRRIEKAIGINYLRERDDVQKEYRARRDALGVSDEPERYRRNGKAVKPVDYEDIIKGGENNRVEFKESFRWSYEAGVKDKLMEYAAAKAISAFINSDGGTLFIGVRDDGAILGIGQDLETLKGSKDAFLVQLTNVMNNYLGKEFHQYTDVSIVPIDGKDICIVEVTAAAMPVFLKNAGKEEFYVRASASSQSMNMREANEYIKTHFSGGI